VKCLTDILPLKFARQMSFDKCRLSHTAVAAQYNFELWHEWRRGRHCGLVLWYIYMPRVSMEQS
jgi:hypothetical protein